MRVEPNGLRVSDADRERAAELLQSAVGDGYITLPEFEERSAAVFAAATREELDAPLSDLPTAQRNVPPRPTTAADLDRRQERQELRSKGSTLERNGPWQVPGALRLHTRASNTKLDFTDATFASAVVDIEIDDISSHTVLILPGQATADCNDLNLSWSQLNNKVPNGPGHGGRTHFVLHGTVRVGNVVVRYLGRIASRRKRRS